MTKLIISFCLALMLYIPNIDAQIELLTEDTIFTKVYESNDIPTHNTITNVLPQPIAFRWVINKIQYTPGWEFYICDDNACYSSSVDSAEITLAPNSSTILDLHLEPNGVYEGYALVEVKILQVNNPGTNVSAYYIFDSELLTSTKDLEPIHFNIYPNPSSGLLNVEDPDDKVSAIKIYSLTGQLISHLFIDDRQWMDISELTPGSYMLQLFDEDRRPIGSKIISKI